MRITILLVLSTSFAPFSLSASPAQPQYIVQCVHMLSAPPVSGTDCTHLLRLLGRISRFHESTTYNPGHRIDMGLASCYFRLRAKVPKSGHSEEIRLIEYFPALQQISDECLETPEGYDGGFTPVGDYFLASLGANGLLGSMRNETVVG